MLTARQQPTPHAFEEPNGTAADAEGAARPGRGAVTDSHAAYECEGESEHMREGRGKRNVLLSVALSGCRVSADLKVQWISTDI